MRKLLLSLVALLTFAGLARADEYYFAGTHANGAYTGSAPGEYWTAVNSGKPTLTKAGAFTIQGNAWNKLSFSNSYLKWNTDAVMTITPDEGKVITRVDFGMYNTTGANGLFNNYDFNIGEITKEGLVITWTGEATTSTPLIVTANTATAFETYILVEYQDAAKGAPDAPVANPIPGEYVIGQPIELTAEEGAVISYSLTKNGTEDWKTYSEPIALSAPGTWTLKAKASLDGKESEVFEGEYIVSNSAKGTVVLKSNALVYGNPAYTGEDPTVELPFEDQLPADYTAVFPGVLNFSWTDSNMQWSKNYQGIFSYYLTMNTAGEFKITPNPGVTINKVTWYAANSAKNLATTLTANTGEITTIPGVSGYNGAMWTGDATGELSFKNSAASGQITYIKYIEVEYTQVAGTGETIETPVITPESGTYKIGQQISVSAVEDATVLYSASQDGSENWVDYTAPFSLDNVGTWTVKARAYKGSDASEDAIATYTIEYLDVAAPVITPESGSYSAGQMVTIESAEGDRIEYSSTTDGTENWQTYTEPFALNSAGIWTVKARAYKGISPSPVATASYTIAKSIANLSFANEAYSATLTQAFNSPALVNPNSLAVEWSSSNPAVATVNNGEVTLVAAGETVITASFAGNINFEAGSASYTLTVNKLTPALSFTSSYAETVIGEALTVPTLNNPTERPVIWSSSNPAVATVDAVGSVRVLATGSTVITASTEETIDYNATSASYTVTVFRVDAPVSDATAQIVVQDYYKINYLSYQTVQTATGTAPYNWKNFLFQFGPLANNVFFNSNYTKMGGSSMPSCVYMPNGGEMTISAPVGATMNKIVINLCDNMYVSEVYASEGEITPQQKGDTSIVWTGNAKNVKFTISADNKFGTSDKGFGRLYMSTFDIDYAQKMSPDAPIIYAEYNGKTYLNDATFETDANTVLTVTAPQGYTSMTCDTYYAGAGQADLQRYYEGNIANLPMRNVGKYRYVFTAYKDENADPITSVFNVTVVGQPDPAVGTFDFSPVDAYNMPVCPLGEFGNAANSFTLRSADVQLYIPAGQKTGHVTVDAENYLEVAKGSYYVISVPSDRRIVSVQFSGMRSGAQRGITIPKGDNYTILGEMDTEALWTPYENARDVRTVAFQSNNYYNDDPVLISTITVNTNVATGVEAIDATDADAEYYTLNGLRVNAEELAPGLYIMRKNGVSRKVMIK